MRILKNYVTIHKNLQACMLINVLLSGCLIRKLHNFYGRLLQLMLVDVPQ